MATIDQESDCDEPDIAQKLAARGYTHLLIRGPPARSTTAMPPQA